MGVVVLRFDCLADVGRAVAHLCRVAFGGGPIDEASCGHTDAFGRIERVEQVRQGRFVT